MDADPSVLLEWLDSNNNDLQLIALDQLCNEILFSDDIDLFCERFPPRRFVQALCQIFLESEAMPAVLEANARALTYLIEMHLDWCNFITQSSEVMSSLGSHLACLDMSSSKSKEFGQQLIKLLKLICSHDSRALYSNGLLTAILHFVRDNLTAMHTDVLQAGMELIRRLFHIANPTDPELGACMQLLSALMDSHEGDVADQTLRAFANLVSRFAQTGADPSPLANPHIIQCLLRRLRVAGGVERDGTNAQPGVAGGGGDMDSDASDEDSSVAGSDSFYADPSEAVTLNRMESTTGSAESNPTVVHAIANILITLCCTSTAVTQTLLAGDSQFATILSMVVQRSRDETVVLSVLRLINILLVLVFQGSSSKLHSDHTGPRDNEEQRKDETSSPQPHGDGDTERTSKAADAAALLHRSIIRAIKRQDMDSLQSLLNTEDVDVNYTDHLGQTLLNWAASFGTPAMCDLLCSKGANVHLGARTSLDYAATFGRGEICRALLQRGADPNARDNRGLRPIDRAVDHLPHPGCQEVIDLLSAEIRRPPFGRQSECNSPVPPTARTPIITPPSIEVTCPDESVERTIAQSNSDAQRVFISQLFPVLVRLFDESSSSSVKRQCILLVRRIVFLMRPDQLSEISTTDIQAIPFAFLLTQLVHHVFIEETDEYVLHALDLSHCLLQKQPAIYVPAFYRIGLVPLIRQLSEIWIRLLPDGSSTTPAITVPVGNEESLAGPVETKRTDSDKATTSVEGNRGRSAQRYGEMETHMDDSLEIPASVSTSNESLQGSQLYTWRDWRLIWMGSMLSVFSRSAFVLLQLEPADGAVRALIIHSGGRRDRMPIALNPGEAPIPRPTLKSHMLCLHQHLMDASETLDKIELWSSVPSEGTTESTLPGARARSCTGQVRNSINLSKTWRRLGMHLGLRRGPELPYAPQSPRSRSKIKNVLTRQASSPARACLSAPLRSKRTSNATPVTQSSSPNIVSIGPVLCSLRSSGHGSRLCMKMRQDETTSTSRISEALLFAEDFEDGFSRVRVVPLKSPAAATRRNSGSIINSGDSLTLSSLDDMVSEKLTSNRQPHSTSLVNLLTEIGSDFRSNGTTAATVVRRSNSGSLIPETPLLDVLFGSDDGLNTPEGVSNPADSIDQSTFIQTSHSGRPVWSFRNGEEQHLEQLTELLFPRELVYETYSTGQLSQALRTAVDCDAQQKQSEQLHKQQRERIAERLQTTRRQAVQLCTRLLDNLLTHNDRDSPGLLPMRRNCHGTLRRLQHLVALIGQAFQADKTVQSSVVLKLLSGIFEQLADLLRGGDRAVTAYELTVSGLVPALLLCLSASHAAQWNCPSVPVGLDPTTALLWYLHERRRVFVQHLLPTHGPVGLGCLVRRLVKACELSDHLPLTLLASMPKHGSNIRKPLSERNGSPDLLDKDKDRSQTAAVSFDGFALACYPLGVIRSAIRTSGLSETSSSTSANHVVCDLHFQLPQFSDCLDPVDSLDVLHTLTPQLVNEHQIDCFSPGMQQISHRWTLVLEKMDTAVEPEEEEEEEEGASKRYLFDWSNKSIRVNSLVTTRQLDKFFTRVAMKQWHDYPRTSLAFWDSVIYETGQGVDFPAPTSTDANSIDSLGGVIDWLSTNAGRSPLEDWVNPALIGLVTMVSSPGGLAACGFGPRAGALIGGYPVRCSGIGAFARPKRGLEAAGATNGTSNNSSSSSSKLKPGSVMTDSVDGKAWFAIDLGLQLRPSAYSMAYLRQAESSVCPIAPRNWNLEASNDAHSWTVLYVHVNDTTVKASSGSRGTWLLEDLTTTTAASSNDESSSTVEDSGWRFFRLRATGPNCNGGTEFALGGVEFYGRVCAVHPTVLSAKELVALIAPESTQSVTTVKPTAVHSPTSTRVAVHGSRPRESVRATSELDIADRFMASPTIDGNTNLSTATGPTATPPVTHDRSLSDTDSATVQKRSPSVGAENTLDRLQQQPTSGNSVGDEQPVNSPVTPLERSIMSEQLLESLRLLDDDQPLLSYLLSSSDESSDEIRRLLQNLRPHDDEPTLPRIHNTTRPSGPREPVGSSTAGERGQSDVSRESHVPGEMPEIAVPASPPSTPRLPEEFNPQTPVGEQLAVGRKSDSAAVPATSPISIGFIDQEPAESGERNFEPSTAIDLMELFETLTHEHRPAAPVSPTPRDRSSRQVRSASGLECSLKTGEDRPGKGLRSKQRSALGRDVGKKRSGKRPVDCADRPVVVNRPIREGQTPEGAAISDSQPTTRRARPPPVTETMPPSVINSPVKVKPRSRPTSASSIKTSTQPVTTVPDSPIRLLTTDDLETISAGVDTVLTTSDVSGQLGASDDRVNSATSNAFSRLASRQLQRRRPRRGRLRPLVSESKEAPVLPTNQSPRIASSSVPFRRLPLNWEESMEMLRLPHGLIPVFNPSPGFTNVPATTPFALSTPPPDRGLRLPEDEPRDLILYLSAFQNSTRIGQICMPDREQTLFYYISLLHKSIRHEESELNTAPDGKQPCRQYVLKLGYRFATTDELDSRAKEHTHARLKPTQLTPSDYLLTPSLCHPIEYGTHGPQLTMLDDALDEEVDLPPTSHQQHSPVTTTEQFLQLLKLLHQLSGLAEPRESIGELQRFNTTAMPSPITNSPRRSPRGLLGLSRRRLVSMQQPTTVQNEDFLSNRLTKKLLRQLHDPLALSAATLPHWCLGLSRRLSVLFTFEARLELLQAAAYGPARSVYWLQNQPQMKSASSDSNTVDLTRSNSGGSSVASGHQNATAGPQSLVVQLSTLAPFLDENVLQNDLLTGSSPTSLLLNPSTLTQLLSASTTTSTPLTDDQGSSMEPSLLHQLLAQLGPNSGTHDAPCGCSNLTRSTGTGTSSHHHHHNVQTADGFVSAYVGRLHKEYVRIPRLPGEIMVDASRPEEAVMYDSQTLSFWDWASWLMDQHGSNKSELEIQFIGENGTGLGPTLEFYSLLAAELRRRDSLMWVMDDPSTSTSLSAHRRPAMPTVASLATLGSRLSLNDSRLSGADSSPIGRIMTPSTNHHLSIDERGGDPNDDGFTVDDEVDLEDAARAYVNTANGLFPAPWPGDCIPDAVLHRFYILGITVAKCLQDNRRIDLPLSSPFLKLLSAYGSLFTLNTNSSPNDGQTKSSVGETSNSNSPDSLSDRTTLLSALRQSDRAAFARVVASESALTSLISPVQQNEPPSAIGSFLLSPQLRRARQAVNVASTGAHWTSDLLDIEDFCLIYPERAVFFRKCAKYCSRKNVLSLLTAPHPVERHQLHQLASDIFGCPLEQMYLSMEFLQPSELLSSVEFTLRDVYPWEEGVTKTAELSIPTTFDLDENTQDAEPEPLSVDNIEQFVTRTLAFCLDKGIRKQMDAFQRGFERVLPLNWLSMFNSTELGNLIAGDSVVQWTREDLLAYTIPCRGYTNQSATFVMLINVLTRFDVLERRAFLQFTTGCSSLPPGGLRNLHPRLRVVRKELTGDAIQKGRVLTASSLLLLPSVNTCMHYLKLPEYPSEEALRMALLRATREIGFYLN